MHTLVELTTTFAESFSPSPSQETSMPCDDRSSGEDSNDDAYATIRQPLPDTLSSLEKPIAFYIDYHQRFISFHHYGLSHASKSFVQNYLPEEAQNDSALYYALVAFAAFQYNMTLPGGQLMTFLGYYSKSMSLLRKALRIQKEPSLTSVLTVLQLTLLEVL